MKVSASVCFAQALWHTLLYSVPVAKPNSGNLSFNFYQSHSALVCTRLLDHSAISRVRQSKSVPKLHPSTLSQVRSFAPSSFLLLVAMPGAPSSVLAPSSTARSP